MPNQTANEITTRKHKRNFIQPGGPGPNRPTKYAGKDAQYMKVEGVSNPESGGLDGIWMHDPEKIGDFILVGQQRSAPELPTATITFTEKHNAIPRAAFARMGCFNFYIPSGLCKRPDDFLSGWQGFVEIYEGARVSDRSPGDRSAWGDADDATENEISVTLDAVYAIGRLGFGEKAKTLIDREVIDVVYAPANECDGCDDPLDDTLRAYAIVKSSGSGSPGLPAEVVYTVDGTNWVESNITGLGATVDPTAIELVGDKLVILVKAEGAIYYATLGVTGIPGAWTKVTTGLSTVNGPNDLYVLSPREIYAVADNGYIYKSTDITAGFTEHNAAEATSNHLYRISGDGQELIVATGASSTVVYSENRGATFLTTTTNPSAIALDIRALGVKPNGEIWVGTSNSGRVFWSKNKGETAWTEKGFSGAGSGDVKDILWVNNTVGYFLHNTTAPAARIFSTWDGGYSFTKDNPRIANLPVFDYGNRLAVPRSSDNTIASNFVAIAGLGGNGTDGFLVFGAANIQ